jgi:hypothetical protein
MDTQNATLEMQSTMDERIQHSEEKKKYLSENHVSDGSELIPSAVAEKGLQDRTKPLTPQSEMRETQGSQSDSNHSPNVQPAYRVTDTGLINAYPVSPPMSKVDPMGKKQFNRYLVGFGLAANFTLGLVVLAQFITSHS